MKIGIIAGIVEETRTGIGTYTYTLLQSLKDIDYQNEYFTVSRKELNPNFVDKDHQIIIPVPSFMDYFQRSYFAWQLLILPFKLRRRHELSLIHDPFNLACFAILDIPFKKVVTIHDIAPIVNKNNFRKIFVLLHKIMLPRVIKKTNIIITDSHFSKGEIVRYLHVNPDRIRVIYPGIDKRFHPLPSSQPPMMLEKYNIPKNFILYVGSTQKQKNVQALIRAYARIEKEISHKLVIVGTKIFGGRNYLSKLIKDLHLEESVIFTGYISDEELPAFYNAASLFVFPSLYEGFGLPPLEAMACGTPVITSNRASLPEAVGDAGIMVDPDDIEGLAKAMVKLTTDEELRQTMIKRGLERVKLFSPEKAAAATIEVYREVLDID